MTGAIRRAFRDVVAARTWRATAYFLLTLPVGTIWFMLIGFGFSWGIGLLLVWVGIPLLVVTMMAWRFGANLERNLLRTLLGIDISAPYRPLPQASWFQRLKTRAGDPATWKDFTYLLLLFPLGLVWSFVVGTLWTVAAWLIALPIFYRWLPEGGWALYERSDGTDYMLVDTLPEALLGTLVGLIVLLLLPPILRGMTRAHGWVARGLLGASTKAETRRRMLELELSRAKAVGSAEAERRRIERDLHDGAQARLVSLAMELGRAKEKLGTDPGTAQTLLEHAHDEAKATIADLRNLARGIHPAVLTDRGLDAALSSLAGRSPVPVRIDVRVGDRPTPEIESIAYFVAAEALTNVAKHAHATEAGVAVERAGDLLVVEVRDDGLGGAEAHGNGGLAGLADRVASVGGRLTVSSPSGGPTVIRAELPCAS